jgi:hypothetical protein
MSLKDAYFSGLTGLRQQTKNAYNAGIAFVGSSVAEVTDLDLGNVNGAALVTGSAGKYFDISSLSLDYRIWFNTGTEVAPGPGGRSLVSVAVLSSDSGAVVASKLAAAVNLIATTPFSAVNTETVIRFTGSLSGPGNTAADDGTLGGTSSVTLVTPGVTPNGSFTTLQSGLEAAAGNGTKTFTITIQTNYNPAALRGNNGNNLILKAYFAGILSGLANQEIYNYECNLDLNTSDTINTSVDFNFTF